MVKYTTNLPRTVKRSLGLGLAQWFIKDKHHYGDIKKLFLEAENALFNSKNKRTPDPTDA